MYKRAIIEASYLEFCSLPSKEWRKDFFSRETGGYVATHVLKAKDEMTIHGIFEEVKACNKLAEEGQQILRLPENTLNLIDRILIDGKPYRDILKFKTGSEKPRGYPDAFFDKQTWDFKTSSYENIDTLRKLIKNGMKADNVVFVTSSTRAISQITHAIEREVGSRRVSGSWKDLPNVYCLTSQDLLPIWVK